MDNQNGKFRIEDSSSTKKATHKNTLAKVLNGMLTFILFVMALAAIGLVIGFIALMINPQLEIFNSYDDFRLLYEFSPISLEKNFEVIQSNPALSNPEIKLLGSINFQIGNRGFVVLFFIFYFVIVAWFVNIIFQLRNFLGSFEKDNPFIRENVKRIRIIGWAVVLFPFLGMLFNLSFVPYFKNIALSSGIDVSFYWKSFLEFGKDSFWTIIFGLVILIVAESFRIATQIKEEQELTI